MSYGSLLSLAIHYFHIYFILLIEYKLVVLIRLPTCEYLIMRDPVGKSVVFVGPMGTKKNYEFFYKKMEGRTEHNGIQLQNYYKLSKNTVHYYRVLFIKVYYNKLLSIYLYQRM